MLLCIIWKIGFFHFTIFQWESFQPLICIHKMQFTINALEQAFHRILNKRIPKVAPIYWFYSIFYAQAFIQLQLIDVAFFLYLYHLIRPYNNYNNNNVRTIHAFKMLLFIYSFSNCIRVRLYLNQWMRYYEIKIRIQCLLKKMFFIMNVSSIFQLFIKLMVFASSKTYSFKRFRQY